MAIDVDHIFYEKYTRRFIKMSTFLSEDIITRRVKEMNLILILSLTLICFEFITMYRQNYCYYNNLYVSQMCCEICKIGVAVGSTSTICPTTPLFYNHQWGNVYQSCCRTASTKLKSISTETIKKYNFYG